MLVPADVPLPPTSSYYRASDLRQAVQQFLAKPNTPSRPTKKKKQVRLMTYNVHGCVGMDEQLAPARIARILAQSQADIVALQELDVGRARSGHHDQAAELARLLEMECFFHPVWEWEEGQYGNAILSRYPLRVIDRIRLPWLHDRKEPRGALWVEVETPLGTLQVINTHLSLSPKERYLQACALLDHCALVARTRGPFILCGDFNAGPRDRTYQRIQQRFPDAAKLCQVAPSPTFFSGRPLARIDHVFVSPDVRPLHSHVVRSRLAERASDHLPLVFDFSLLCPSAGARTALASSAVDADWANADRSPQP